MKKLLCMLLSVLFIISVLGPGFCLAAEEEPFEPPVDIDEYSLTTSITASLSISGNTAKVAGRVGAKFANANCSIKVQLQKKTSSGSWTGVKTWTNSGTQGTSAGGTVAVSAGSYRTCVTATITHGNDSEHPFSYSATKTRK